MEFLVHNMAPIMFAALVIFLLLGYPVAFALAANGIFFGLVGIELGLLQPALFQALPERVWGVMSNDTLLAVPFFTFMGLILERSGMAEDLLDTIGQVFGPLRGGLAFAVIFVGALLAATTGVVAASVISMGLISLPIMLRYGYDRRFASGVIAASGTLAQIIPPSLVLIIMADQLGKSVGDMYAGAFIPGFVLTGLYALFTIGVTLVKPAWAPALPPEARLLKEPSGSSGTPSLAILVAVSAAVAVAFDHLYYIKAYPEAALDERLVLAAGAGATFAFVLALGNRILGLNFLSRLAQQVVFVLIPPLGLIFLVLGTIFLGWATPTEGGAMGASGALIMAIARRRLSFNLVRQAMDTTAKLSTFVLFILIGARVFSLTFYGIDGHKWVEELLVGLPGGQLGFLIVVNILVFLLAFFLDFFELSFIVVPLLGPVAEKLGIDLIWFGVLLGVNMQTSFMHPPFGFALFYLRSVAPANEYTDRLTGKLTAPVTTGQIYWGAVPFVMIQIVMIGLVIVFPQMVMVYKDETPQVDPAKMQFEIPETDQAGNPDDILKDLQKPDTKSGGESQPAEDPAKAIEDAIKGSPAPAGDKKEKTAEEKAAEEIEKAVRGDK
jgi:TRAP-type mannitol/chloroaromatic compound transport system permease large subunit